LHKIGENQNKTRFLVLDLTTQAAIHSTHFLINLKEKKLDQFNALCIMQLCAPAPTLNLNVIANSREIFPFQKGK
jgi:hypothetical protein